MDFLSIPHKNGITFKIFGIFGDRLDEAMLLKVASQCKDYPIFANKLVVSELNICNFCSYSELNKLASDRQKIVKIVDGSAEVLGYGVGKNLHFISTEDEELSDQNFVAWMPIIPEKCCC